MTRNLNLKTRFVWTSILLSLFLFNQPAQAQSLIDMGLSDRVIPPSENVAQPVHQTQFSQRQDYAIIAWARTSNAQAGELKRFIFLQPDGQIYQTPFEDAVGQDFAQVYTYAGYDLSDPYLPKGEWKVVFQVKESNQPWETLGERDFKVT
jgi:hypothetical protein